jgi:KUP system potassium uptake protein
VGAGALLTVDLLFLAANLTKLVHGAWLPLLIGVTAFTVMTTWARGRELVVREREREEGPLREFVDDLRERRPRARRVPGTAVYLNPNKLTAPLAMRATVDHLHALSEQVVILSIETKSIPHVPVTDRLSIDDLGYADDGITHVNVRFGYMDKTDVPGVLRLLEDAPLEFTLDLDDVSYFLSTIELRAGDAPGLSRWRKELFLATAHVAADAAEYFHLPRERTVIIGSRIEV